MTHNSPVQYFLCLLICLVVLAISSCVEKQDAPVAPSAPETQLTPHLSAQAAADLWVYQESLASPWLNASWSATTTYGSTEFAYEGTRSIKVALTSAWGALSVHHGTWGSQGLDPSLYTEVEFAAYTATTGARLGVLLENDAGQDFPSVTYGTITAGQWTVITIPMSQLNPNGQTINRIDIQDLSGGTPTFYIDNFRFVGTESPPGTPPATPTLSSPTNGATGVATDPALSWSASNGASSYRLQISTVSSFSTTVRDQNNIAGTSYSASDLSNSTTYYWRVNASNVNGTSDWSNVFSFTTADAPPPPSSAPDLTVDANRIRSTVQVRWRSFSSSSCAVVEECTSPGSRKLLRFEVTVPNFGTADVFFGDPADNPELFIWSPCHGHYHFEQFAEYRLLNASNQQVVVGRKQAFCMLDSRQYWSGYPSRGYDCEYQGISVGWADVYARNLDCQWLDITGIPSGDYIIEVEVNVGGFIDEGPNTHPNIVRVPVRIQ